MPSVMLLYLLEALAERQEWVWWCGGGSALVALTACIVGARAIVYGWRWWWCAVSGVAGVAGWVALRWCWHEWHRIESIFEALR